MMLILLLLLIFHLTSGNFRDQMSHSRLLGIVFAKFLLFGMDLDINLYDYKTNTVSLEILSKCTIPSYGSLIHLCFRVRVKILWIDNSGPRLQLPYSCCCMVTTGSLFFNTGRRNATRTVYPQDAGGFQCASNSLGSWRIGQGSS